MDRMDELMELADAVDIARNWLTELQDALNRVKPGGTLTGSGLVKQADGLLRQIADRLQPIMGTEALADVRREMEHEAAVEASITAYKAPTPQPMGAPVIADCESCGPLICTHGSKCIRDAADKWFASQAGIRFTASILPPAYKGKPHGYEEPAAGAAVPRMDSLELATLLSLMARYARTHPGAMNFTFGAIHKAVKKERAND